jgi:hypothetical protein
MLRWIARRRRLIFRYYDGQRYVWGDPLAIWGRLGISKELGELLHEAELGKEPALSEARQRLRAAFEAVPYDRTTGKGLTDWELFELFLRYASYIDMLKKKLPPGRMPLLIAALRFSADSSPANSTGSTGSGSASSSTPRESSAAAVGR